MPLDLSVNICERMLVAFNSCSVSSVTCLTCLLLSLTTEI